jgi:NAD(P)-dependent dehydrogenase (short-subunit alcohol dehydrogenase family)
MLEFAGKTALVTGAGSGIGAAAARKLASMGAQVALLDQAEAGMAAVRDEIVAAGGQAFTLLADVSQDDQMQAALQAVEQQAGRLDVLVISAGINGVWAPVDDITPAEWDRTMNINLRGTYLSFHYGVPLMKKSGGGAITVISSMNGQRTFTTAGASCYSASKAAQLAMATQLALELGFYKIRVNTVCPGQTVTGIGASTVRRNMDESRVVVVYPKGDIPATGGRPADASDIADGIAFLSSGAARHISGAVLNIDGGQSLIR